MTTFNLNFDNAANYTLSDSNAITVANSTATLKGAGTPLGADSFTSGGKSAMWNYYNGVSFTEDSTYGIYTLSAGNYTYGYESVASVTDFELGIGGYTNRGQLQIVLYQDANNNLYIYKNFNGSNNWNVYYGGKIGGVTVGPSWTQEINNNTCDIKLKRVGSTVTAYNRGTLVATYTFNSNPGKIQIINSCQGPYTTSYINSFNFVSATSILNYPTSSNYTIQTTNTNHFTATTANKIDSITIPTSIPANTSIKSLVSFDGRATWKYWNTSQWTTTTLANIETTGMTPTALNSALTGYVFQAGDSAVDLAFSLKTTSSLATPTVSGITMNYSPFNNPPIAPSIADVTKYNLNTVIQLPAFTDPDGNTLTYSVSGLPSGMTFDPSTRRIKGVATTTGQHSVTMTANDGAGGVTNQGFLLTLNKVPTNTKIEDCFE